MSAAMVAAVLLALALAACAIVYVGDPRSLQPSCVLMCEATAAKSEDSPASPITQTDENQAPLSNRGGKK